ncbi:MAG: peptidylprolyl isomerase [Verrucomicrobia bacterium]|nr:peptidylprolyl isomerase [Verrucomicrobiota bacterium]
MAKGDGVEVTSKQVEDAFISYKSSKASTGQQVPESQREQIKKEILNRLVVVQILVNKATDAEKEEAAKEAEASLDRMISQASTKAAFERQLLSVGTNLERFRNDLIERAVCEKVIQRDLKPKLNITEEKVAQFYEENPKQFKTPEQVRASHILIATKNLETGEEYSEEKKAEKKKLIEDLLKRARDGEDFAELAAEHSEDPGSKEQGGEYTFARGRMVPAFEAAAFSLEPGQISDVVTTSYGYHIIKLHEKIPAETTSLEEARADIKNYLEYRGIQKLLPAYLEQIKEEANVEIMQ